MIERAKVLRTKSFGHSYAAGYWATGLNGCVQQLAANLNAPLSNYAVGGSRLYHAITAVFQHPAVVGDLVLFNSGLNDLRLTPYVIDTKTGAKAKNVIRSVLASTFAKTAVGAQALTVKWPGTWSELHSKSCWLGSGGVQSTAFGQVTEYVFEGDNVVVGFMSCNGTTSGTLGTTEIYVDNIRVGGFDPNNQTDGTLSEEMFMPALWGVASGFGPGKHLLCLKALGNSAIVDWIGTLKAPEDCPQVAICEALPLSAAGVVGLGVNAGMIAALNTAFVDAIKEFKGYPVTFITVPGYDPATDSSVEEIHGDDFHPNDGGHARIFQAHQRLAV